MPTLTAPMPALRNPSRPLVDPAVFAERLISHDKLERLNLPEDDLLGLRNAATGEVWFVSEARFQSWLCGR